MKTCSKCGVEKHGDEFGKLVKSRDGLRSECKACRADWRAANRGKVASAKAAHYAANRDRINANCAAYREANPEKCKALSAAYYAKNSERIKDYCAEYKDANREKIKVRNSEYRATNHEKCLERVVAYQKANPDRVKSYKSNWAKANPESRRIHNHNRRARKLKNGGKLSKGLAAKLFKFQRGKCACCHVSLDDGNHLDHRIPVALDGPNEDWNMQLLCPPCNLSKGAKHPVDFMQAKGFLL